MMATPLPSTGTPARDVLDRLLNGWDQWVSKRLWIDPAYGGLRTEPMAEAEAEFINEWKIDQLLIAQRARQAARNLKDS